MALKKSNKQRSIEERVQQERVIQNKRNETITRNLFFICFAVMVILTILI